MKISDNEAGHEEDKDSSEHSFMDNLSEDHYHEFRESLLTEDQRFKSFYQHFWSVAADIDRRQDPFHESKFFQ